MNVYPVYLRELPLLEIGTKTKNRKSTAKSSPKSDLRLLFLALDAPTVYGSDVTQPPNFPPLSYSYPICNVTGTPHKRFSGTLFVQYVRPSKRVVLGDKAAG
jgi:hypothetical protein